jgi:hypothetical protein
MRFLENFWIKKGKGIFLSACREGVFITPGLFFGEQDAMRTFDTATFSADNNPFFGWRSNWQAGIYRLIFIIGSCFTFFTKRRVSFRHYISPFRLKLFMICLIGFLQSCI